MKLKYADAVAEALEDAPVAVRKAFFKQTKLLGQNLRHPSLRAKKYDEAKDRWQARVNKDWRFYFTIIDDTYYIFKLIPTPNELSSRTIKTRHARRRLRAGVSRMASYFTSHPGLLPHST